MPIALSNYISDTELFFFIIMGYTLNINLLITTMFKERYGRFIGSITIQWKRNAEDFIKTDLVIC